MLFFLIVLLTIALDVVTSRTATRAEIAEFRCWLLPRIPYGCAPAALIALVLSFAYELVSVAHVNAAIVPHLPWVGRLPISVIVPNPPGLIPSSFSTGFALVAGVQALLVGLYLLAMLDRPWRRCDTIASACAASAVVVLAVFSPAITSYDMYAYIADALLGSRVYDPPLTPLPSSYAIIHLMWFLPLYPGAYGPIWLWWNHAVLGLVSGLLPKLLVLRLENVVALAVTLGALRRLDVPPRLIAAAAVNPAIAFYFLSNGHNDLVAIAIVLVAMTFAERMPVVSGIVAGIGASAKITLVIPAAAAALVIGTLPKRLAYVAAMGTVAAAIALLGGESYFRALTVISQKYAYINDSGHLLALHIVTAVATIVLTAVAILTRRTSIGAVFAFASLAQGFFPWYVIWGLPYAAARNGLLATLLIGFPIMTALLDVPMPVKPVALLVTLALLAVIARAVWRERDARAAFET